MSDSLKGILDSNELECEGALDAFKRELKSVRSGRASSGLVEGITVDYYGAKTPLGHLGQISTPEARTLVIQPYDPKAVPAIEKAIQTSSLGLNPAREGDVLRVNVPPLNEETRREIVRHLHKLAEDIRVSVRNHRRTANEAVKKLEKDSEVTKDEAKKALDQIQQQTNSFVTQIDQALAAKEAEVMEV